MKIRILTALLLLAGCLGSPRAEYRYVGGDISLLPEYENAGAKYRDESGKVIADLIPFLHSEGMNAMRIRLFNNPESYKGSDADPNACQDLDYIIPLCKRIKNEGLALILDFHYSDTWADPGKQWTPAAWKGMTDGELNRAIYDFTAETLRTLGEAGVTPDFIQPGNEISFGMMWGSPDDPESELKKTFLGSDANWERLGNLLKNAIRGCREVCPDAGIILHTERTGDIPVQDNFYSRMKSMGVDYDIIGLSYYPYYHGNMAQLEKAVVSLEKNFADKKIMIVETGYTYKWDMPGMTEKLDYPSSLAGQNQFTRDLVDMLLKHESVDGLFWWWPEYNPYGTNLSNWYNAPLFDATTGKATPALKTLCSFAAGNTGAAPLTADADAAPGNRIFRKVLLTRQKSDGRSAGDDEYWFDLEGRRISDPSAPGLYLLRCNR